MQKETSIIRIKETGHDYDFIATVENLTAQDIVLICATEEYGDIELEISACDWAGLLADSEGRAILNALYNEKYCVGDARR